MLMPALARQELISQTTQVSRTTVPAPHTPHPHGWASSILEILDFENSILIPRDCPRALPCSLVASPHPALFHLGLSPAVVCSLI